MKAVNVGLIGLGTVGTGVVKILLGQHPVLENKLECMPILKAIADRNIDRKASKLGLSPSIFLTNNPDDLINNNDIDIIVEVIGGISPAKEIILKGIEKGKSIITANKELLALHGAELFKKAHRCGSSISFEASVCGGIPIIATLRDCLIANRIESIYGIVNGTSNYVLTKMAKEEAQYHAVLVEAQSKGYAEKDPSKDVNGVDSAHKLAILARLGFSINFDFDRVYYEGISAIELEDIRYAQRLGYTLKLLAISKNTPEGLELRVHPALLPNQHPLASVNGVYNGVYIKGDAVGQIMLYGLGAGSMPTASSVVADIVDVSLGKAKVTFDNLMYFTRQSYGEHGQTFTGHKVVNSDDTKIMDMYDIRTRYYLHFLVTDAPGVLAKIAGIIGSHNISIASVIQQEGKKGGGVPLVMLTHVAKEGDIVKAFKEIKQLEVVKGETRFIRIEDAL